jgi:hypothetical protein
MLPGEWRMFQTESYEIEMMPTDSINILKLIFFTQILHIMFTKKLWKKFNGHFFLF